MNYLPIFISFIIGVNSFNNFADVTCGQRSVRTGKIVGGETAAKSEFPWMVSITRRGGHFCGGTVISNKFVLTAAHCLCTGIGTDTLQASHIKLTMAQHDLTQESSGAFEVSLRAVSIHPEYTCGKAAHDIALLEVETPLQWSSTVSPACLATGPQDVHFAPLEAPQATVTGWGWTHEVSSQGGRAKVLQKANVNVIGTEKCRQWFKSQGKKTKILDTQICAGHEQGGIDACWADSGGPLMVNTGEDNQMMVVGVVSTGIGCARPFLPGLYTRISEYIPWIREILKQ